MNYHALPPAGGASRVRASFSHTTRIQPPTMAASLAVDAVVTIRRAPIHSLQGCPAMNKTALASTTDTAGR